jgi:hypothetical protein
VSSVSVQSNEFRLTILRAQRITDSQSGGLRRHGGLSGCGILVDVILCPEDQTRRLAAGGYHYPCDGTNQDAITASNSLRVAELSSTPNIEQETDKLQ